MKKLIFTLIILFVSFEISFAITGVWLLEDFKKEPDCSELKSFIDKQLKDGKLSEDVKKKYPAQMGNTLSLLTQVMAGKIVDIKKGGNVDFHGTNPMEKKKGVQKLNNGKWVRDGNKVQISPKNNSVFLKFGTFIAKIKGNKAKMVLADNKIFMEQISLLTKNSKIKKCMKDEFAFSYSKLTDSNYSLDEYKKMIFKNLLSTNKGVMKTCFMGDPEYLSIKGNKISGAVFDRLNPYSEATGLKIKYKIEKKFDSCLKGMKSGKYDVMTLASKKPERTKYMDYYFKPGSTKASESVAISKKSKFAKFSKEIQKSVDLGL